MNSLLKYLFFPFAAFIGAASTSRALCNECQLDTASSVVDPLCSESAKVGVYESCSDQKAALVQKIHTAMTDHKLLLLVFGSNGCSSCLAFDEKLMELESEPYFTKIISYSIGLLDQKNQKSASGYQAVRELSSFLNQPLNIRYMPTVFLIDPQSKIFLEIFHMNKNKKQLDLLFKKSLKKIQFPH